MSLCLTASLVACTTTKSVVISEPEIVESVVLACPVIPVHLLRPCVVMALPEFGIVWADTIEIISVKDMQQRTCNNRFAIISQWQSDNIRD